MAQTSSYQNFRESELQLQPFIPNPTISDDITKTLSHNLAFDHTNQMWRLIAGDRFGRLNVTKGAALNREPTGGAVNVTNVASVVFPPNPDRQYAVISNNNNASGIFQLGMVAIPNAQIILPAFTIVVIHSWTGSIYVAVGTGPVFSILTFEI